MSFIDTVDNKKEFFNTYTNMDHEEKVKMYLEMGGLEIINLLINANLILEEMVGVICTDTTDHELS